MSSSSFTLRSNGPFSTILCSSDDRFDGIFGSRCVVLDQTERLVEFPDRADDTRAKRLQRLLANTRSKMSFRPRGDIFEGVVANQPLPPLSTGS
jgi:hypothetical protein